MGVPGLWEYINKVGISTSLAALALEAFEKNENGQRVYRLGIDANIWMTHADKGADRMSGNSGAHPQTRTLFFRICNLARLPIAPVFVFDGRMRPGEKRNSKKGKSGSHALSQQFKDLLKCFGMAWREAIGEAEAELAYLNRIGEVDAIMTDDVDAFLFGAKVLLKNQSSELSGNKRAPALNADGKADKMHYMVYRADDIKSNPAVGLTRGGMILFALLAGGDYSKGLDRFGPVISRALAQCGFGDDLVSAYENLPEEHFRDYLTHWRTRVNTELRENKQKFLAHRTTLQIPSTFPELDVLQKYAKPLIGESCTTTARGVKFDLAGLATFCEKNFDEWGHKKALLERFRNVVWPCAVMHVLRRSALEADQRQGCVGTPPGVVNRYLGKESRISRAAPAFVNQGTGGYEDAAVGDFPSLIIRITTERKHASTDNALEYRIEVSALQLVDIASSGIKGLHPPQPAKERKKSPDPPEKPFLMWMPAAILKRVHPTMIEEHLAKKKTKGKGKQKEQPSSNAPSDDELDVYRSSSPAFPAPSSSYSNIASSSQPASQSRSLPASQVASTSRPRPQPASQSRSISASQIASRPPLQSQPRAISPAYSPPVARHTQPHPHSRQQPRAPPARQIAIEKPGGAEPVPFKTNVVLEPWFTAPSLPLGRLNKPQLCRGFYFTFADPGAYEPIIEDEPEPQTQPQHVPAPQAQLQRLPAIPHRNNNVRAHQPPEEDFFIEDEDFYHLDDRPPEMQPMSDDDDPAREHMARVFNRILLAPNTKKAGKRKAPARGPAPMAVQPPSKRPRTSSSSVLDCLDTIELF